MERSELLNRIIDNAVIPELHRRFHDTVGVVVDYDKEARTAHVMAHNPYTGNAIEFLQVGIDDFEKDCHLNGDPKKGDYVKVGFINGDMASPFIRKILSKEEIREMTASKIPSFFGFL
jgi:hypothetical protein